MTAATATNPVAKAAERYAAKGYFVCRVEPGEKNPKYKDWPLYPAPPESFTNHNHNIGIQAGPRSAPDGYSFVWVDIDSLAALGVDDAEGVLPETGMIEGRPGKPRAHRGYLVPLDTIPEPDHATGKTAHALSTQGKHPGHKGTNFAGPGGELVIEVKGTGQQCVVAPSLHESGERREWHGGDMGEPAVVTYPKLLAAVGALASRVGWTPKKPKAIVTRNAGAGEDNDQAPITIDGVTYTFAERTARAAGWAAHADPSILHQNGSNKLIRLCYALVNDFALRHRPTVETIVNDYNAKLADVDKWPADQIAHKIDDALARPRRPDEGHKLSDIPYVWNDPAKLASEYLEHENLVCIRDTAFHYQNGRYVPLDSGELKGKLRTFAEQQAKAEYRRRTDRHRRDGERFATMPDELKEAHKADIKTHNKAKVGPVPKVESVAFFDEAVRARCQLPSDQKYNVWINGATGPARLLPVANGLLDLSTAELLPHSPDFFSVVAIDTAFDPAATCPRWDAYIRDVTANDDTKAAVLQEMAGVCLDANSTLKWFGILHGSGDNGKSVYLNTVVSVLGERNTSGTPLAKLAERFDWWALFGKLLNAVGDDAYHESKDESELKKGTGHDAVVFEAKGRDPISARNTAKLIFSVNTVPTFSDPTDAVWNRLVLVPFTRTFTDAEKVPAMLHPAGYFNMSGVLNWMIAGLQRVATRNAFTCSKACVAAKHELRNESKPAYAFLTTHFVYDADAKPITADDMYTEYTVWLSHNGYTKPLIKPKFGRELLAIQEFRGVESKPARPAAGAQSVRCYFGLRRL